ncbi:MAG: hypothetical protein JNJ77_20515 [Planctomycetia bacterium]|nr:hypothetical protein [Planctomycetia bacterium]
MPSPLFWLLLIGLAILVWLDGVAAGRNTIANDKVAEKQNSWKRAGNWLRQYVKNPTPGKIVTLFVLLLVLRLLLGLAPMLLFLLATLFWR